MVEKIFTNCFLVKNNTEGIPREVSLAMKKRGFGEGLWNGSGGKPKDNEGIQAAALREVEEEFNVKVTSLDKKAVIEFILRKEDKKVVMHTFLATDWIGEPIETEEMRPKWFSISEVPYDKMWKGDKEWLPIILSGKKIRAKYTYSQEGGEVESREIVEVNNFGEDS